MLRRRRKRCLIDICQVGAVFQEQLRDKIHVLSHHAAKRRKDPDPDPDNENGAKHILQTKRRLSIAQNMAI